MMLLLRQNLIRNCYFRS